MQVPGHKYDQLSGLIYTRPKTFALKIRPADKQKDAEKYKIVKSKNPDCGSYNSLAAYKKTQTHRLESNMYIGKCPRKDFITEFTKKKKGSLAPGHYKGVEKAYDRLSTSPMGLRMRRH